MLYLLILGSLCGLHFIATIAQRIEKFVKLINRGVEGKPVRLKRIIKKISYKP